jgi:signal transduction histidine kinase
MKPSLRTTFAALWLLIVIICSALAFLVVAIYRLGVGSQVETVEQAVEKASGLVQTRFASYLASFPEAPGSWSEPQRHRELELVLQLVLSQHPGVEGGFWHRHEGFVAYSFPTYEGGGPKRDVPEAESARIVETASAALSGGDAPVVRRRFDAKRESLLISARPASGSAPDLVIWTMSRAHLSTGAILEEKTQGFVFIFFFALFSGGWLLWILGGWLRRVRALERAIAAAPIDDIPPLHETGDRELDRIVTALNRLSGRLRQARQESRSLNESLARSERVGALGRMAAHVAHEIRNPIAALRLRAENALAKPAPDQRAALEFALHEIARLDDLIERLLAVTRLQELECDPVALRQWVSERCENLRPRAEQAGIELHCEAPEGEAVFDRKSMTRALDNLLLNAFQHTPAGGRIRVSAECGEANLRLRVEDSGPGIAKEKRDEIFEPFTTGRSDGTGLGLSVAREIVEAHAGSLRSLDGAETGACFEIEIPRALSERRRGEGGRRTVRLV